ncbi:MAG: tRNA (adenosine(37)-N6)-threonylcarbamoyltransferase complex ATPase subunit type 1 TsaE [Tissierellia bacterium]|nr:tRNA (adenosine(37)-N6)-threonylcarbamoyltransferase complex ATPase subunit type 1 TsaE [Tissierellia bacterium]
MEPIHDISYFLQGEEAMRDFGRYLAAAIAPDDILCFIGDLGAGKTTLIQGLAQGMGIMEDVSSATFSLMNIYRGPLDLYHFDAYRMEDPRDFYAIGGEEVLSQGGVSAIEWAGRVLDFLPEDYLLCTIHYEGAGRKLEFSAVGERGAELLAHVAKYEGER